MAPDCAGPLQRGLLVRHAGGCLSPRVLDFLCFNTPRSVLGAEEGEEELPFFLLDPASLDSHVQQGLLPCPALWMDAACPAAGHGTLQVVYRLGGALQHCPLPGKPLALQPIKQGGGGGTDAGGSARRAASDDCGAAAACRAFVSAQRHMQLYRLAASFFPKLEQLERDLASDAVVLRSGATEASPVWCQASLNVDTATVLPQAVVLERLDDFGLPSQLLVALDFAHASLVVRKDACQAATPDCLRTVGTLAEALAVLHGEGGAAAPGSLPASPAKPAGLRASPAAFQSPAKPPLPAARGAEGLRLAVALVRGCVSAQLREGLALLAASAGSSQLCAAALGFGALEALVAAAATVLPTPSIGMAELQPSILVAVTALLDAAPSPAAAATRLATVLAAALRQPCANPLLLCRLLAALLRRPDVRAAAMRQGLADPIADMYARMSPAAAEAAAAAAAPPAGPRQPARGRTAGFGSPVNGAGAMAAAGGWPGQAADQACVHGGVSDSGSDRSPSLSRSCSPVKGSPLRSPFALSTGRFAVPRLALPAPESPPAAAGLTRSTRRALSATPGAARSPSPYGSPSRRGGARESSAEPSAAAELATLAAALGESLMAADLPAIVAHKRAADAAQAEAEAEEEAVPPELVEAPAPPTVKKVLAAHRILVTARSLRSVDSSPSRTATSDSAAAAAEGAAQRAGRLPLDVQQIRCLLLQALSAALPLLEPAGWPSKDPSPILAAEVAALLGKPLSATQEQLKQQAVRALLRLAQRPGAREDGHVLVAVAGARLDALTADGLPEEAARAELLALLQLLTEYVTAAQHPSVATALARHCLCGLQCLLGVLQAGGLEPADWRPPTWQLLAAMVPLLAAACRRCEDGEAGRGLLALLLGDREAAAMLAGAASHVLLPPDQPLRPGAGSFAQRSRAAALQRDLLHLFAALAALVGRQQPCVQQPHKARECQRAPSRASLASTSLDDPAAARDAPPGPGQDLLLGLSARRGLTRRQALLYFGFLVSPHSGLAQRILEHDPAAGLGGLGPGKAGSKAGVGAPGAAPATTVRLRQGLLELLKAAFAAPGSPFAADKFVSDYYIRFHFVQFLKLYHNPHRDHQALFLCRQHMDTLLALARERGPHIRHRFQQLSVVDFFVRELSLEFEAKQPPRGRMHRLSSGGSQLEHRRTSSCSTLPGFESGNASPVPSLRLPTVHEPEAGGVPLLRLPSRVGGAAGEPGSGASSPAPQPPPGVSTGGRGLAVPRLNLGAGPAMASPGGLGTPSPGNSARHGRPPLPPSARSGVGATPRLTSRLGRTTSARASDPFNAAAAAAAAPAAPQPAPARPASGGGKPFVPQLGLGGLGRSLPAPAASDTRPNGRVHFSAPPSSRTPRRSGEEEAGSDSDSSCEGEGPETRNGGAADVGGVRPSPLGFAVPAGFTFTGDLEEDLDRLEALEGGHSDYDSEAEGGPESESASPTIPALRASPFQARGPVPPLLALAGAKGGPPRSSQPGATSPTGRQGGGEGLEAGGHVPRLNLAGSMHSNLEARNATAELQLAADAGEAKGRAGCGRLGEQERGSLGRGKPQGGSFRRLQSSMSDLSASGAAAVSYSEERGRRLLYRDEGLHLEVLQLVFCLVLDGDGQLDATYCDQYPWERKLQNIPFILYHHLNHEDNRPLLPHLLPRLAQPASQACRPRAPDGSGAQPALRLLRLLCSAFFRPEWYTGRSRISSAQGAYSTVYRASLPPWAGGVGVVLKLVDTPRHIQDRCAQVDVQGEVSVLASLAGSPAACQLYDWGVDPAAEAMFLVLRDYRCSLKQWRARQPACPAGQLRLYYALFGEVTSAAAALLERGVVHFDLKCDNCLLEPLPGVSESEFWAPSSERLPFRVVLADFGESLPFSGDPDSAVSLRARGTDCFKSPEMLLAGAGARRKEACAYDRRRRPGAGPASDVWSLGCLLFELVTGKLLFSDSDWLQLLAHVTSPSMPLVTEDRAALLAGLPGMLDLLQYILVRDASMRPTLSDVQARLAAVRSGARARLPPHARVPAPPGSARGGGPAGLQPSGPSQLFSPTAYAPSPKATMPMPLMAALPMAPGLTLAPLALLDGAAALRQHASRRVVLLFGPGPGGGGPSPASAPGSPSSGGGSPLPRSRRYGGTPATRAYTFAANPVFSPGAESLGVSSFGGAGTTARTLTGTPRLALRFGAASPSAPAEAPCGSAGPSPSPQASPGCSPSRPLLGLARVHPDSSAPVLSPLRWQQAAAALHGEAAAQPCGLQLILPPTTPLGGAAGLCRDSGQAGTGEAGLLARVLADAELSAAAGACAAAGVDCRLCLACPMGRESRNQPPLALTEWLAGTVLPLLEAAPDAAACRQGQEQGGQQLPVLLAVQAGWEAEGAMAAVGYLMRYRQISLYHAMVAASQWGVDLHLRPHHLLALQHWAAAADGAPPGPAAAPPQPHSGRGRRR